MIYLQEQEAAPPNGGTTLDISSMIAMLVMVTMMSLVMREV